MIKNLIIILLIYIISVLLFDSSSNVDLLKQKSVEVKEFIWKGVNYADNAVDNLNRFNLKQYNFLKDSFFKEEKDNGETK